MHVYLDESGDLGWALDKPFRAGGSSQYLTLAFLLVPREKSHLPKRTLKRFRLTHKFHPGKEVKGSELTHDQKLDFCLRAAKLCARNSDIRFRAITVKKVNVKPHIRRDGNKLYNYMTKLGVLYQMSKYENVLLIPDERSIKIKSGNSLEDYLQTALWFEKAVSTRLECTPLASTSPQGSPQNRPTKVTSKPANEGGPGPGCFTATCRDRASLF